MRNGVASSAEGLAGRTGPLPPLLTIQAAHVGSIGTGLRIERADDGV
jgi:hypothetical protein